MHTARNLSPRLLADLPPIRGRIRQIPEDFRVDEVPAYEPSGQGSHLFVRFEKVNLTTPEAVRRLANALGVSPRVASWAGMKDRRAVTTQWASFEGADADTLATVEAEDVRILEAAPNDRKLKTGHLRANRFALVIREVDPDRVDDLRRGLTRLQREGLPNYYASQRFGRDGANVDRARAWLVDGGRPPRDRVKRKWDVSVLQSWLFNRVLAARVTDGLLARAVPGDLMKREDSGGLFVAEDVDGAQRRMDAWEISPTGPMFGPRMRSPEGEAAERERAALGGAGLDEGVIRGFGRLGRGARRPLRAQLDRPVLSPVEGGVRLEFTLPSGTYATALLDELLGDGLVVEGDE